MILRQLNEPPLLVIVYWWNPVLIKEFFNSAHMDLIAMPFVLLALLCAIRKKYIVSVVFLALATGAKLWPVVLLPVALRPMVKNYPHLVTATLLFILLTLLIFMPVFRAGLGESSGFEMYGRSWEMNDAFYMTIFWISKFFLGIIGESGEHAHLIARIIVVMLIIMTAVRINWKKPENPQEITDRFFLMAAAVFLISPTQFPWYYSWLLPFLVMRPRFSLLLLTILLPLYYLRFYLESRELVHWFDYGIVWVEHVPVWVMLILEWRKGMYERKNRFATEC
jgi:hypothetical protein